MRAAFAIPAARRRMPLVTVAAVAATVFLSAAAVIALREFTGRGTGIWIANAAVLVFLLRNPRHNWPSIMAASFVGNMAADLVSHTDPGIELVMTLCNLAEVLIIAYPLRLLKLDRAFSRPRSLLMFYALAVGPAPLLTALIAMSTVHAINGAAFGPAVVNWYAADALGLTIIVPQFMTVRWAALKAMFGREQIWGTLFAIGMMAGAILLNLFNREYPIAFLFFPAVIFLTFQRGFAGGMIGLAMLAVYMVVPVLVGDIHSTLRGHTAREQVILVQVFVAVIGFSVVLVGAALEERRRLERGLAGAIARAESAREEALVARDASDRANRAKSMFLANMSHELRTPLNAVIGFSEIMHHETFGPLGDPRYREYSHLIQEAGRHLLSLINDVLDMSKIEAGKHELTRERLSVAAVVHECLDLVRDRADQAGLLLRGDVGPGGLWVVADRRAMKQILLNLLSNAIKFTPEGGEIVARARISGGMLTLTVSDNGIGIPADQLYRLGNPFVQLKNSVGVTQPGTGLGLALCRALTQLHEGTLRIESKEGVGTTVTVTIPAPAQGALAA